MTEELPEHLADYYKSRPRVRGFCPMGCGESLALAPTGHVQCINVDCDRPSAASLILHEPETEHLVLFRANDFVLKHPLRERLDGDLFECEMNDRISRLYGPPAPPGKYRVRLTDGLERDLEWETLP